MANLGLKDGIYHIRFRFRSKEYKRSLKIRDRVAAEAAKRSVELTLHRLLTGFIAVPAGTDPGDFIVSGGNLLDHRKQTDNSPPPSARVLTSEYLKSRERLVAESYRDCQAIHLRHLLRHLDAVADAPCDNVSHRDLEKFLQARLAKRDPTTVKKERSTLVQFYRWVTLQGYLSASPGACLPSIKGGKDRPPFRTLAEINRIIARGGLSREEVLDLWECLHLAPVEIAGALALVSANAQEDLTFLLHAIPAYTGMRRGEVLRLRWLDVSFDDGFVTARSRKQSHQRTETARRIDLHPELKQKLLEWRRRRSRGQYLICDATTLEPIGKDRANRLFWQPLRGTEWCLDSKRNWFKIGFHTYRHSFASNLAARGVDQRIIDEFMGHTTQAMTLRYRHLFPNLRQLAIRTFSLSLAANGLSSTATE